ncbi:MAG: hypothetical protein H6740_12170 [Alphaproteobacteria bacterium]|nr:hypothetical protein [Alphaproteobacteria bacterium]
MSRWLHALVFLAPLVVGGIWIQFDQQPAQGFCCEMIPEIREFAASVSGAAPPWRPDRGWIQALSWPGLMALGEDGPLWAMLICVSALQLGQLLAARQLAGARAGLLAAALAPAVPLLALAQRRVDAYAPQCALLALGLAAALASRGFTRRGPTLAFIALCALTATSSPNPTDNYLATAALGGLSAGVLLRALLRAEDAWGEPVSRRRALLGGGLLLLVTLAALALGPRLYGDLDSLGLDYYRQEVGRLRAPSSALALSAYWGHLFARGFGLVLGVPLVLGAALWLRRGRGRAELLGVVLPLGLALSLLTKKNVYYLAPAWPALALLPALGVAALRGPRLRWGAGITLLALAWTQLAVRAFPAPFEGGALAEAFSPPYDANWGWTFQASDLGMDLAPRPPGPGAALAEATAALGLPSSCECGHAVFAAGKIELDAWWLRAREQDRCLPILYPPVQGGAVGLLLIGGPRPGTSPLDQAARAEALELAGQGFERRALVADPDGDVQVYARPEAWFEGRCALGTGSPPV